VLLGRYLLPLVLLITDYTAILLAEGESFLLHWLLDGGMHIYSSSYVLLWIPLLFVLFLGSFRSYTRMRPLIMDVKKIVESVLYGTIVCIILLFFVKLSVDVPRVYMLLTPFFICANLVLFRVITRKFLKTHNLMTVPVLIIGAGKTAKRLIRCFEGDSGFRYRVIGFLDDHPIVPELLEKYPLFGNISAAEKVIKKTGVQTVVIAIPGLDKEKLTRLIENIQLYVRNIKYIPDLIETPMASITVDNLFNERMLMLGLNNNLAIRRNRIYKRVFDLVCTFFGILVISPILLILALYIRLDSKGPVFFNAGRIGKDGKTFKCYKFRSMYMDSDRLLKGYLTAHPDKQQEWDTYAKLRGYDPRVTRAGVWMRKYSLDELPQLFNVILGDMSLVGPRPYLPREKTDIGANLGIIEQTVPGITGYWQVNGRNDTTFAERVEMDVWYVRNWSIWLDLMYLTKTFTTVFAGRGGVLN
jgi:undecaprenyl-phosphate galactose phosphotransferase